MPVQSLVPTSVQRRDLPDLFGEIKNRMTDFQRLRRNVLRDIHDHSASHRMLFSYAKMEQSAAEMWDSLLHNAKGVGPGPIQEIRNCSFSFG